MKKTFFALLVMLLLPLSSFAGGSTLYPWLTDYSFTGVSSWSQPLIASGASLPADANAHPGDLFINTATSTAPTLWRRGATTWHLMSGASTSGDGVSTHSLLLGLSFADSGHTGFNSAASHALHLEDQTDPHGASMTVSEKVTIGSGPADVQIYHVATGVVGIATDVYVVGKVGIGTSTPQAALHVADGGVECISVASGGTQIFQYTKLGDAAPALKCKLITGTTPGIVASSTTIATGLTSSKIVGISPSVGFGGSAGRMWNGANTGVLSNIYSFDVYVDAAGDLIFYTGASATAIIGEPFSVLLWYTE